jgi:hypothetical protein
MLFETVNIPGIMTSVRTGDSIYNPLSTSTANGPAVPARPVIRVSLATTRDISLDSDDGRTSNETLCSNESLFSRRDASAMFLVGALLV